MSIDAGAFTEWILAKAEKQHGVAANDRKNIELVLGTVGRALLMDSEEVHVECTLEGSSGPVRIDERLTRSALGVLFAQVHVPARRSTAREAPSARAPNPELGRLTERDARIARKVFIVAGLVLAGIIASCVGWAIEQEKEKHHEQHDSHDKREMHR